MTSRLILASGSEIRAQLLRNAGVAFDIHKVAVDEEMIKQSLLAEAVTPRDISDALAEAKSLRASAKTLRTCPRTISWATASRVSTCISSSAKRFRRFACSTSRARDRSATASCRSAPTRSRTSRRLRRCCCYWYFDLFQRVFSIVVWPCCC